MKTFKINNQLEVIAESKNTHSGFKHEATLLRNNQEIVNTKINYYNRTWESYDFESVLIRLKQKAEKQLTAAEKEDFEATIKDPQRIKDDLAPLKMIANFAKLSSVLCNDVEETNSFKKSCLSGMGVDFPDNWDTLQEEEKANRLNNAINQLTEG